MHDETPWCAGFINFIGKITKVWRSRSLAARSYLNCPVIVTMDKAEIGFDVVILERGSGGHIGFFAGYDENDVLLLGGNQGDSVSYAKFPRTHILGIRRLQ